MDKISFAELWKKSGACLKNRWLPAIGVCLIACAILGAAGSLAGFFLFPLTVGVMLYFLRQNRNDKCSVCDIFEPFKQYWRMIWAELRVAIFIFLHFLMLIIPGYIAIYRYSLTYYIMLDEPALPVRDAMKKSRDMMYGHKMQMFGYSILLGLLAVIATTLTAGIALIWLVPFLGTFTANYYLAVKADYERKNPPAAPEN